MNPLQAIEPWLRACASEHLSTAVIVGKGPSSADLDLRQHPSAFVIAINEASLSVPAHAAFVIDEDILLRRGVEILDHVGQALITPRVLHCPRLTVGGLTIYAPVPASDMTAAWRCAHPHKHRQFNLSTAEPVGELGDVYRAFNFSGSTLANLLARNGFRNIVLAGIDGGTSYAPAFDDVAYKRLRSIQQDFDVQFEELREIRRQTGISVSSVRCPLAHVMIGAEPEQALAEEVLKWSIESRTFLDVHYCKGHGDSRSRFREGSAGTPFSLQRVYMPEIAGARGRSLYLDSDMLVFRDVYEVFNADMQGNELASCLPTPGRAPQYSVFLVENALASWQPDEVMRQLSDGRLSYRQVMNDFTFVESKAALLPMAWNSLERFEPGVTANLHYTDMEEQPWLSLYNQHAALWCEALLAALGARPQAREVLERSLECGWVRPSLRWQVEQQAPDPWSVPSAVRRLDRSWHPPHVAMRAAQRRGSLHLLRWRLTSQWRRLRQTKHWRRLQKASYVLAKVARLR